MSGVIGRLSEFFGIGGDLVTIDFDLALLANEDAAQSRSPVAVQMQPKLGAISIFHADLGTRSDDVPGHAVVLGTGFVVGRFARVELAAVHVLRRFFQHHFDGPGFTRPQAALDLIVAVSPPAGHSEAASAAVVGPPATPPAVKVGVVGTHFCLVRPDVPPVVAAAFRHLLSRFGRPMNRADKIRCQNRLDLSDRPVLHQIAGPVVQGDRALLGADLGDALVLPRDVDHVAALGNGQ